MEHDPSNPVDDAETLVLRFEPAPRMSARSRLAAAGILLAGLAAAVVITWAAVWFLVQIAPVLIFSGVLVSAS